MLKLQIMKLMLEKGIHNPQSTLRKMGFAANYASKLNSGKAKRLDVEGIEKLCLHLNCTPNELFTWVDEEGKPLPAQHPLGRLRRPRMLNDVAQRLKRLQPDELLQIQELAKKLENGRAGEKHREANG